MNKGPKTIAELLADESFLKYCGGDETENVYWKGRFDADPGLKETAQKAKRMYELLKAELTDVAGEKALFKDLLEGQGIAPDAEAGEAPVLPVPARRSTWMWAAASAAFIAVCSGIWIYTSYNRKTAPAIQPVQATVTEPDAAPGRDMAVLILADGSTVLLDSTGAGQVASEGNARIMKQQDGQVLYEAAGKSTGEIVYNTMQTPRGGQYRLVLSDGTGVWLNASSSIRYPTAFDDGERKVTVTGEVYFEVAARPDPARKGAMLPFIVEKDDIQVQVLGTHFNVNAYEDEAGLKVTLLEGSVRVSAPSKGQEVKLIPGQQAIWSPAQTLSMTNNVDTEEVMAWKNGLFDFNSADIETIMRQIGRWYDLDVSYEGVIPKRAFSGKITRHTNLSNVLRILEQSNIHFRMEEKNIIVTP